MPTTIPLTPPADFRFAPTAFSHGWCQLPPFSYSADAPVHLSRLHRLSDGTIVHLRVEPNSDHTLRVIADVDLTADQQDEARRAVTRCLNLDQDLTPFYDLLRDRPGYGWIEHVGAGRLLISPTVWEDLAKILLTTNTTWTVTRQMVGRLVTLGEFGGDGHVFPMPEQVAALSPEALHAHVRAGYRSAYLHELATAIAEGRLNVESWYGDPSLSGAELYKRLKALKGFGDYAAGGMMRLLHRYDQLGLDSVCRDMFRKRFNNGQPAPDSAIHAYYESFGTWKGLTLWMDVMWDELVKS